MYKMFGINNCDTVKKAKKFLDENHIEYEFIDFKKFIPSEDDILRWKVARNGDWPVMKKVLHFAKLKLILKLHQIKIK